MILGIQTHGEICTKGLTLLITHKKKKEKEKERVLSVLGPSDFLLSIKQSLSHAGVLGPDTWEK